MSGKACLSRAKVCGSEDLKLAKGRGRPWVKGKCLHAQRTLGGYNVLGIKVRWVPEAWGYN